MKSKLLFLVTMAAVLMTCDINNPQQSADQLIIGKWQVYKILATGNYWNDKGEPIDGTREIAVQDTIVFDFHDDNTMNYSVNGGSYWSLKHYSLQKQNKGTWLLTIDGLFNITTPNPAVGGFSPITIYKISDRKIEWEYTVFGGDEGPDVIYQYLKHL